MNYFFPEFDTANADKRAFERREFTALVCPTSLSTSAQRCLEEGLIL